MLVGHPGEFVELTAGDFAEPAVMRRHMLAQGFWQIKFQQALQALIHLKEVLAVRIRRDPIGVGLLFFEVFCDKQVVHGDESLEHVMFARFLASVGFAPQSINA